MMPPCVCARACHSATMPSQSHLTASSSPQLSVLMVDFFPILPSPRCHPTYLTQLELLVCVHVCVCALHPSTWLR